MGKKVKRKGVSLYHKFTLTIILIGLVPVVILSTFIANRMIQDYRGALHSNYTQAVGYVAGSLETMLDSYNTVSKIPYNYNYSTKEGIIKDYLHFDNLRQIIYGVIYAPQTMEVQRKSDMEDFLKYVESVDNNISGAHFVAEDRDGQRVSFHHSFYSTYFKDEKLFEKMVAYNKLEKESNKLILIAPHTVSYFSGMSETVFTIARNYFDLRGNVGEVSYVGTLFIDINLDRMEQIFRDVKFSENGILYVVNENGDCFYSSDKEKVGHNIGQKLDNLQDTEKQLILQSQPNEYGLKVVVVMDTAVAFGGIRFMQRMMYFFLAAACLVLLCGSLFFSKRLTNPIHEMMKQMSQVEGGNFDIKLSVRSSDEIGVLSERFNQMSAALKKYINQSYMAQIKQTEAELTALKSQIYPHFLYNTLEIIRMTAVENSDNVVSEMIEALSEQIHYLIGPMKDMVPLEKELDIIQRYVYLLNCRIKGKIRLMTVAPGAEKIMVPKLVLQPIVENAYVHGIKPEKNNGSIMVEAAIHHAESGDNGYKEVLEITVMDNGIGMDAKELEKIQELLKGNEPGIKNEDSWQSVGMKNVHDRIRFLYGEDYGIQVTSTVGVGTMVRLLMPVQEKQEND